MFVKVLMEDLEVNNGLQFEHGFSVYVETKKNKILVDTGKSELTWSNAEKLNIDLNKIEKVFLSHGHYDHSGGLLSLAKLNPNAKIYMHEKANGDYYSIHDGKEKYIGIDKEISNLKNINLINSEIKIDDEISIFTNASGRREWPQSNLILKKKIDGKLEQDDFIHEMYVVIEEDEKTVLISGCAHNGILNILDRFKEVYNKMPDVVISGFHMMKKDDYTDEEIETIKNIASELSESDTKFYTGHCTSMKAFDLMKPILKDKIEYINAGSKIKVGE